MKLGALACLFSDRPVEEAVKLMKGYYSQSK